VRSDRSRCAIEDHIVVKNARQPLDRADLTLDRSDATAPKPDPVALIDR